jgi:hypothetical protein
MSTEAPIADGTARRSRPWLVGFCAFAGFSVIAAALSKFGIQEGPPPPAPNSAAGAAAAASIVRIVLPAMETSIPSGPNHEEFRVACTVCHSARLVFTQPLLTEGQWTKVVQKMTGKYGAPLSSDQEKRIVAYLHTVHGKK